MLAAIRSVAAGHAELSPTMTRALLNTVAKNLPRDAQWPAALTPQETALLRQLAAGKPNAAIAAALDLTEATVTTHVSLLLAKIGARDRAHAVAIAYQHGLPAAE